MPFAAARWFPSIFHSPEMSFSAVTWFPATLAHWNLVTRLTANQNGLLMATITATSVIVVMKAESGILDVNAVWWMNFTLTLQKCWATEAHRSDHLLPIPSNYTQAPCFSLCWVMMMSVYSIIHYGQCYLVSWACSEASWSWILYFNRRCLPHKVKTQYLHFTSHARYFPLSWKIPEVISRQSILFHN